MAIQNVFANLADPKTMQDFQNEMIAQNLAKEQLANAQIQNKANTLSFDEARRKADINSQINQAGRKAITYDTEGNPLVNQSKLTGLITEIDPLTGIEYGAKQAKTQKDLKASDLDVQLKELGIADKTLANNKAFISSATQALGGVRTPQELEAVKQQFITQGEQLGIKNNIQAWTFDQIPQLINQGVSTEKQLDFTHQKLKEKQTQTQQLFDNTLKTNEFSLKQQKEFREQAGILTPKDEQDAIKEIRSARLSQKNAIKADERENALAGLNSFFNKDKNGNIKYKYSDDKGVGTYDLRLIVSAIKADDPTSTVSENEVRSATGTESWFGKLGNDLQRLILDGSKLNNAQRLAFYNSANNKIAEQRKVLQEFDTPFIEQIKNLGLPLSQIFTPQEIKRYKLDTNSSNNDRRSNPLGGLPNAPANPFSPNANVPPPPYTTVANTNGNIQNLGNSQAQQTQTLVPNLSTKKFTELPLADRQFLQTQARQANMSVQDYYNGLQRFKR